MVGPGGERLPGDAVEVDLRTLELRAAKLREAAAAAAAAAMRARFAKEIEPRKLAAPKKVKP